MEFLPNPIAIILQCHYFGKMVFKSNDNSEVYINNIFVSLSSTMGNRNLEESPHGQREKRMNRK